MPTRRQKDWTLVLLPGLAILALIGVDILQVQLVDSTRQILEGLALAAGPALGWGARGAIGGTP